ncbi:MAG: OmpA family protein [Muribaculaceae bacterium]|jgi:outer membrane protein OmpA-like peptidoglycan-associated protein|nr:OmpA family protein [Muribaculaceae bacterium]
MKKIYLALVLSALFLAPSLMKAQEVKYVEDPAQGYLFNRMQDNWFISLEGGANVLMSRDDSHLGFGDRIAPVINLSFGKWFSPLLGVRIGVDGYQAKGVFDMANYDGDVIGARMDTHKDGNMTYYKQKFIQFGPKADVLFNLTNWICGYRPGRFYNAIFYMGGSEHWVYQKPYTVTRGTVTTTGDYKFGASHNLALGGGLLNTFALSKHVDLLLDLRAEDVQEHFDGHGKERNCDAAVLLGLSYKFNKVGWGAPVVPVCPKYKYTDAEGDALAAQLQDANAKISDLEQQLKDCLNRPQPVAEKAAPTTQLANIYFPINVSKLTKSQVKVANGIADVMKKEHQNYVLTGWADNYTGTDAVNKALRKARVATVKNYLVKQGVPAGILETTTNDGNLTDSGKANAAKDRAVTVMVKDK